MRKNLKVLLLSLIVAATMIPISAFADTTAEAANEAGTQAATESTTNSNDANTEVKNGWVTENGSKYYYVDDKCVTGKQSIEGKNYFFSETGVLQTGWIPSGSSKMYAGTDGVLVNGIQTISGKKYYFSGIPTSSSTTIDGGDRALQRSMLFADSRRERAIAT